MMVPVFSALCNVVRWQNLRLWAENGMVHCEDGSDGSYRSFSVRTALGRADAINKLTYGASQRQRHSEDQFDPEVVRQHIRFVEQVTELCNIARQQGEPHDPAAQRDRLRRRAATFVVPGLKSAM